MKFLQSVVATLSLTTLLVGCGPSEIVKTRSYERTPKQTQQARRDHLRGLVDVIHNTGRLSEPDRNYVVNLAKNGDMTESMMALVALKAACDEKVFERTEAVSILESRILATKDFEALVYSNSYLFLLNLEHKPNSTLYTRVKAMAKAPYFSDEIKSLVKDLKADPKSQMYAGILLVTKAMNAEQKQWALGQIAPLAALAKNEKKLYWDSVLRVIKARP